MNNNIDYYDQLAQKFADNTFEINMSNLYQPFLKYLPKHGKILDIGCGSGRDALYFHKLGFTVDAFDYSESLVKLAREKTSLDIQHKSFYDLDAVNEYDGIWACASLLHCERSRLIEVIQKIITALKINGVCYVSFKYGDQDRTKDGRSFTDLNEEQAHELLANFENIQLLKQWITSDNRPDREENWLNMLIQKTI